MGCWLYIGRTSSTGVAFFFSVFVLKQFPSPCLVHFNLVQNIENNEPELIHSQPNGLLLL